VKSPPTAREVGNGCVSLALAAVVAEIRLLVSEIGYRNPDLLVGSERAVRDLVMNDSR
jgi:hypothetical protein